MEIKEIIELIDRYWKFDNNQIHTHSWHDKQDLLNLLIKQSDITIGWINVNERHPEIIEEYGESDDVLCVGHKGTHPNEEGFVRYEIMSWKELSKAEQTLIDWKGKKIKYGWSNRWWDTNPDLYSVSHWMPLPKSPQA